MARSKKLAFKLAFSLSDRYWPISERRSKRERGRTKSSNKSDELDGTKVQFRKIRLEWDPVVKSRVSRNCVFEGGRGGESGGTLKIRKIRFWAERRPALWGSTNRDRRGNKRCTTASRECPRIRFIIGLAHPASSPPPVEKSLGFSLLASRISPRLVRVCGKYTWKEDSFGLPFDSLCSSPPFLKIISDLKSYRVNSSSFRLGRPGKQGAVLFRRNFKG